MPDRNDALDIEALETMIASAPFAAFRSRVKTELDRACHDCETADDLNEIMRAQGAAQMLRVVLELPESMLKQMQKVAWKASNSAS